MKASEIIVGTKFYIKYIKNPNSDEFGVLEVIDVKIVRDKRCVNLDGGGMFDRTPAKYEPAKTIKVKCKNQKGEKVELSWWYDEFEMNEDIIKLNTETAEYDFVHQMLYDDFKTCVELLREHLTETDMCSRNILLTMRQVSELSNSEDARGIADSIIELYNRLLTV